MSAPKDPKKRQKWIENLRKAFKDIPLSETHKKNIGKALKGRKIWNTDLRKETDHRVVEISARMTILWQDPEHQERVKEKLRGRHSSPRTEFKKGHIPWDKNKSRPEEQIQAILHRRIPSGLEKKMIKIIGKFGLPYRFTGDGSFIIGHCNPDFVNTNGEKIAIEVFAKYFKELNGRNVLRWKHIRRQTFRNYGWDIIFFSQEQVEEKFVLKKLLNEPFPE